MITGSKFLKLLKRSKISHSVYAYKAEIQLSDIKNLENNQQTVPKRFLKKLSEHFSSELPQDVKKQISHIEVYNSL